MNKVTLSIFAMCTAIVCIMVGSIFLQSCSDEKDSPTGSYVYKVTYVNGDIDTIACEKAPSDIAISNNYGATYIDFPDKEGLDGDVCYVRRVEFLRKCGVENKTIQLKNKQKIE